MVLGMRRFSLIFENVDAEIVAGPAVAGNC